MFRIGDFSHIARVSTRLLRHYDRIGLFRPDHVDPQNGYRYYSVRQLEDLNRILALRDLGLNLGEIRSLVDSDVGPDDLRRMLLAQRTEARRQASEAKARVALIESRIAELERGGDSVDLITRNEPDRTLVGFREVCTGPEHGFELLAELTTHSEGEWTPAALLHSEFDEERLEITIGYLSASELVGTRLGSGRALESSPLSGGLMLTAVRVGDPVLAHGVYSAMGRWMTAHNHTLTGEIREVFRQLPRSSPSEPAVVEVQFPIAPLD